MAFVIVAWSVVAVADDEALKGERGWGDLQMSFKLEGKPPPTKKLDTSKEPECSQLDIVDETLVVGPEGGIQNVMVWLVSKPKKIHPEVQRAAKEDITIHLQGCRFEPHSTVVAIGQKVHLKNGDTFGHNAKALLFDNDFICPVIPASGNISLTFDNPESRPGELACNIHPWMQGDFLVRPNLYAAVSDRGGVLSIANLPVGKHQFIAWRRRSLEGAKIDGKDAGWKKGRFEAEIRDGETTRLDVTVAPEVILGKRKL
jgi:plastocyanin